MKIIKKNTGLLDILQAVILFGFALYFVGVVASGSVYRYVHERQVAMLLFSAAVFVLLGIVKLRQGILASPIDFRKGRGASGGFSFAVLAAALAGMAVASGTEVRFSQFAYTDSLGGQSAALFGAADASPAGGYASAVPKAL